MLIFYEHTEKLQLNVNGRIIRNRNVNMHNWVDVAGRGGRGEGPGVAVVALGGSPTGGPQEPRGTLVIFSCPLCFRTPMGSERACPFLHLGTGSL